MSNVIDVSFIQAVADCLGVKPTEDASKILAPDVEYRIKEIIQEAGKFARHSKRTSITPDDVNNAFRLKNVEPIYGLSNSSDTARFLKLAGHPECYYIDDPILPTQSFVDTPLPPLPWEADLRIHWLAIDGEQPAIPANIPILPGTKETTAAPGIKKKRPSERRPASIPSALLDRPTTAINTASAMQPLQPSDPGSTADTIETDHQHQSQLVRLPLKHLLSKELLCYFDKISHVFKSTDPDTAMRSKEYRAVLSSLSMDAGISPLSPYLCKFFAEELINSMNDPFRLVILLRGISCIAANGHLDLSANLHVLIPVVLTCLLGKESGIMPGSRTGKESTAQKESGEHWNMRDHAGRTVAALCARYPEIAPRIERKLLEGLRLIPGTGASLHSVYGAAVAMHAQGPRVVRTFLLPNLIPVMMAMQDELTGKKGGQESMEAALKARSALLSAAGQCIYASTACAAWSGPATVGESGIAKESKKKNKGPRLLQVSPDQAEDIMNKKVGRAPSNRRAGGRGSSSAKRGAHGGRRRGAATAKSEEEDDGGADAMRIGDDDEEDANALAQQAQQADASLKALPRSAVFHAANQGKESLTVDDGEDVSGMDKKRKKGNEAEEEEGNYLIDAWRDDFPVDKMKKAMVELFGKDVEPYQLLCNNGNG